MENNVALMMGKITKRIQLKADAITLWSGKTLPETSSAEYDPMLDETPVLDEISIHELESLKREGPDHAPCLKVVVNFNGDAFKRPHYCSTLRQAEHAAPEVAINSLSHRGSNSLAARIIVSPSFTIFHLSKMLSSSLSRSSSLKE
nr:Double-stranded RNA-binding protein 2 [Ipomoea batatas]